MLGSSARALGAWAPGALARPGSRQVRGRHVLGFRQPAAQVRFPGLGARRGCAEARSAANQVRELLEKAEVERAELKSQLHASTELYRKRNELLQESLRDQAKERTELVRQVESLTRDVNLIAERLEWSGAVGTRRRIQRKGVAGRGAQSRMAYRPTPEFAEKQPTHVCELSHETLAMLAMLGDHTARRERLLREVMSVEGLTWGEAHKVFNEFDEYNERFYWLESLPYRVAITAAFIGGVASAIMVFWKPVALWYGVEIAGEELPEGVKDIDELTINQVGTWTWSWMEPMIGTASFVLLCCQFVRAQGTKLNMKTYQENVLKWRGDRLARAYPQYDNSMLRAWAKHMPKCGLNWFPTYERHWHQKGPRSGL